MGGPVDTMTLLSHALRGAIVAGPGKRLFVADYSQIEARVLLWLAGDEDGLDIFRRGEDIYADMAKAIDPERPQRQLGKVAILGLGYGMGAKKFVEAAKGYGLAIDLETAQKTVDAYRSKYWRVKRLWKATEAAAKQGGDVDGWYMEGRFLYHVLPSGRRLAYPDAEVQLRQATWGQTLALTYMGTNPYTRKWERQWGYGGLLVENIVQAIARDVMAAALLRCERSGVYQPILSVHDEIIAEASRYLGDVDEFKQIVSELPAWAEGLPVAAEAFACQRYHK